VTFNPIAIDNCPNRVCLYAAERLGLPKGVTIVNCVATDAVGLNSTTNFTITVVDPELPVIVCPATS